MLFKKKEAGISNNIMLFPQMFSVPYRVQCDPENNIFRMIACLAQLGKTATGSSFSALRTKKSQLILASLANAVVDSLCTSCTNRKLIGKTCKQERGMGFPIAAPLSKEACLPTF